MADELAVVGDRVDQVQRRQTVEAVLVFAALDCLLLPLLQWRELAAATGHEQRLAAGVMHEHAFLRVDEQRFLDIGLDAQRADQRFGLPEILALDGGRAAAGDHPRHRVQVFIGFAVAEPIGGDALRDGGDQQSNGRRQRAGGNELRA
jgi:hypothetical protein